MIAELGLTPPNHLRFLPKPDVPDLQESEADLAKVIHKSLEGIREDIRTSYVNEGVDPKLAENISKAQLDSLDKTYEKFSERSSQRIKGELEAFFKDPDFRDPAKLADLILDALPD